MTAAAVQPLSVSPGDRVPPFVFQDRRGKRFGLGDQSISGQTLVLWYVGQAVDRDAWGRLILLSDAFRALDTLVLAISDDAAPDPGITAHDDDPKLLSDPNRQAAQILDGREHSLLVVDRHRCLVAVVPGPDFEAALAICQQLHEQTQPRIVLNQAPVLLIEKVLDPELCHALIEYWTANDKTADRVSSSRDGATHGNSSIKRRADVMLTHMSLGAPVKQRIEQRVLTEVVRAFGWPATRFEAIRIGCYDAAEGGYFLRHRDNTTPYTAHRRFAMSLNLNSGAYTGGQVRFPEYGRELYAPPAGGALVFSCSLLHEAMPVTEGRRFAAFTFFYDEAGEAKRARMAAAHPDAARAAVTMRKE